MKSRVKKWGNSLAVRIPAPIAQELGLKEDVPVQLELINGQLTIWPLSRRGGRYNLSELVEGITVENIHPAIEVSGPVGDEVW